MHRTLVASPHIGSYSALLLVAFIAGWWVARRHAKRAGIPARHIDNLTLLTVVTSLFGARLFSWFFYFPPGYDFWRAMTMGGGGMVFYGGLIFGLVTVLLYSFSARLSVRDVLDVFAAPAALGLALGRIGCFLAGCCWGDVCIDVGALSGRNAQLRYQVQTIPVLSRADFPLALTFPREAGAYEQHQQMHLITSHDGRSLPVHPVQLYEAVLALALALGLRHSFAKRAWPGKVAAQLVLGYALIRFATEFLRADNQPLYWGMTLSQMISLLLAGGWVALLASLRPFLRKVGLPLMSKACKDAGG